jgi:hypothetical protein
MTRPVAVLALSVLLAGAAPASRTFDLDLLDDGTRMLVVCQAAVTFALSGETEARRPALESMLERITARAGEGLEDAGWDTGEHGRIVEAGAREVLMTLAADTALALVWETCPALAS